MKLLLKILKIINTLIQINFINLRNKILDKKNFFLFHPREQLTLIHKYYLDDFFNDKSRYSILFGHKLDQNLGKNYFFIKESFLKYIFFVDIFFSNNICDKFTPKSKKIYIHHNIYDSPMVRPEEEGAMLKRLTKYDFIFLPNKQSIEMLRNTFLRHKYSEKNLPKFEDIGYAKLTYLEKRIKIINSKKNSILIAPTNFRGFPNFTIINNLREIIDTLVKKYNIKIILRPHPSNRNEDFYLKIKKRYEKFGNFLFDVSENYLDTYSKSKILITDISGTAYTYSFLTLCPVVFFSNETAFSKVNYYKKLKYFIDRDKIGTTFENVSELEKKLQYVEKNKNSILKSILEIKKENIYFDNVKNRFNYIVNKILNK